MMHPLVVGRSLPVVTADLAQLPAEPFALLCPAPMQVLK